MSETAIMAGSGWRRFVDDHRDLPLETSTTLFSWPQAAVEEIQLAAARRTFAKQRDLIPALRMLADAQGVGAIQSFEDLAPLLFPHTTYKSYADELVDQGDFARLTRWYGQLTHHDLGALPSGACKTLDDWLIMLAEASPVQPRTSSGTTGKTSFLPSDADELKWLVQAYFVYLFQGFGDEPHADLSIEKLKGIPYLHLTARYGPGTHELQVNELVRQLYDGDESMVYALNPGRLSAEKKRAGGGPTGANIAAISQAATDAFFNRVVEDLAGKPILTMGHMPRLYEGAMLARQRGIRRVFSGGFALVGGGMKGQNLPPDYYETILEFLGDPVTCQGYGCSEQMFNAVRCPNGNFHMLPMVIPFQLDLATGDPLPRSGTQTGRYAFFNLFATGAWGGLVTGDAITMTWDRPCGCGRNGPFIHPEVRRLVGPPEGNPDLACSGSADAHRALQHHLETFA